MRGFLRAALPLAGGPHKASLGLGCIDETVRFATNSNRMSSPVLRVPGNLCPKLHRSVYRSVRFRRPRRSDLDLRPTCPRSAKNVDFESRDRGSPQSFEIGASLG